MKKIKPPSTKHIPRLVKGIERPVPTWMVKRYNHMYPPSVQTPSPPIKKQRDADLALIWASIILAVLFYFLN